MVTLLPDEQTQIRVRLEDLHSLTEAHIPGVELALRRLREAQVIALAMAGPESWPAILVTRTQEYGLLIVDGYHRREAARRRKLPEILADIRPFANENEVIEAAFKANIGHGLPASAATRSDYAYWLFRFRPELKQNEIARRVGIKPSTVNAAIRRRERKRKAAEDEQKRREFMIGLSREDQEREDRMQAEEKELAQIIRAYLRYSHRLYERLKDMDGGERYWALNAVIADGDKVTLFRLIQYLEHYLKTSLPPDLMKSLNPPARSRRTKSATSSEKEASRPEVEQ